MASSSTFPMLRPRTLFSGGRCAGARGGNLTSYLTPKFSCHVLSSHIYCMPRPKPNSIVLFSSHKHNTHNPCLLLALTRFAAALAGQIEGVDILACA